MKNDRRLVRLRHELGVHTLDNQTGEPRHAEPVADLPEAEGLPEVHASELTPELLRTGILRDGCLLVRELVPRDAALELAAGIDNAYAVRSGERKEKGLYEELETNPRFVPSEEIRPWVQAGGGLLGPDSPVLFQDFLALLDAGRRPAAGRGLPRRGAAADAREDDAAQGRPGRLRRLAPGRPLHGQRPRAEPVAVAVALRRRGAGPRRRPPPPGGVRDGGHGATSCSTTSSRTSAPSAAAKPKQVLRPIFEPGDAMLFDDLFLHKTGSDPAMPKPRYAVESWFFGASAFPEYAPIAV